jgi:phage repressor protein C with HTH and peptisase S24 domain
MSETAERLVVAMKNANMTQADLHRKTGFTRAAISKWVNGQSEPKDILTLARILGVTPEWLQTGKEARLISNVSRLMTSVVTWDSEEELNALGDYVYIPRYNIEVSAGNGMVVWEESIKEQAQAFRREFVQLSGLNPKNLRVIYCRGDSMQPRIYDGDSLTIDMSQTSIVDGKTYIVRMGDEIFCQVLRKLPLGGVSVISLNPEYPAMTVSADESHKFEIVARVVQISSMGGL